MEVKSIQSYEVQEDPLSSKHMWKNAHSNKEHGNYLSFSFQMYLLLFSSFLSVIILLIILY